MILDSMATVAAGGPTRASGATLALRLLWVALTVGFVALRLDPSTTYMNADEAIVLKVSEGMTARGDLNTNWQLADLPVSFRYDQFNFSSYNLVAHAWLTAVGSWLSPLAATRLSSLLFQLAAVAVLLLALRRTGATSFELLAVGGLLTVSPTIVHDALLARPESFLYLLFACLVWLALGDRPAWQRAALAGAILGFGAATKITFLSSALLFAPALARQVRASPSRGGALIAGAVVLAILAFALGAPHAIVDPAAFVHGLRALHEQYAGGHPPHSAPHYSLLGQILWLTTFYLVLYGPLLPAAFLPVAVERRAWWLALWLAAVVPVAFFASQAVFFERNLSLTVFALPALMLFGLQRWPRLRAAVTALSLAVMLFWSIAIVAAARSGPDWHRRFERAHGLAVADTYWLVEEIPACTGTMAFVDYGDPRSAAQRQRLLAAGHREIATYRSILNLVPTSSLQPDLDRTTHYFDCDPVVSQP